jgi:hypothetical protein
MPIQSEKQRRFMEAVRHNPEFAKKAGVSKAVAEKFVGPKAHAEGGIMKESKKMVGKELAFLKAKKAPKSMIKHEEAEAKGKTKKYSEGGYTRAADGVATHGRTKGKMVKMMGGGKC